MDEQQKKRSTFSGKLGFVLAAAGASVGLGNIWRFPYLAAKYGGGIFLLVYIILALTFGFSMIVAETALGRMTGKSPVGAFARLWKDKMALLRRVDQCDHPDFDCPVLFRHRRLGYQVSGRLSQRARRAAGGGRLFYLVYLERRLHGGLLCNFCPVYAGDHLCGCPQRHRAGSPKS